MVGGFEGTVHVIPLHVNHSSWQTFTRPAGDVRALACFPYMIVALIYCKMSNRSFIESFNLLDGWRKLADIPNPLQLGDVAMVTYNDLLFVVGGHTLSTWSHCVATAAVFDVGNKTWSRLPDLNTPRSSCSAAVVDNTLYVGGGRNGSGNFINSVETLDLGKLDKSARWREVAPTVRYDPTLAHFNGKLLAIGGLSRDDYSSHNSATSTVLLLDNDASQAWLPFPDLNHKWMSHGAFADGNLLVVAGGLSSARYVIESAKLEQI